MVFNIAERLNASDSRPQFTKVDEPMTTGGVRGGGRGYGAYFGSVPDMTADVKGVRFSDVRPGSPAAKAGLQGGDVMIRFAGKEVTGLQDFAYLLGGRKPGDVVEVVVLRNDQPVTVQVKLEMRR
ncbi:MAG: PDZ domain-containing protein, partial [Acidobacteria bacterium]|nr:PDZ domain-containing protein [Acidobacteriota bacterium]